MNKADVIIIGAGAAGLAAAYELSLVDKKVIVLEGRDRIGGRIQTLHTNEFENIIETGAEFIHGDLPLTKSLLKKAGIEHLTIGGKMYRVYKSELEKTSEFIEGWDEVMSKLESLQHDTTIAEFLQENFPGKNYEELRQSIKGYVEGYDAADTNKASAFALREEWEAEEEEQGRIDAGYTELMQFFAHKCAKKGTEIKLSQLVKRTNWKKGEVEVVTQSGESFFASKVIITIPIGVWQSEESKCSIAFSPNLSEKFSAAQKIGFGGVIKFNLQFSNAFWEEDIPHKMKKAGFILSDAKIPTWWTQNPKDNAILSGWIAGPKAYALKDLPEEALLQKAVHSLAYIFSVHEQFILNRLKANVISNWIIDPYTLGAYSYATLETKEAKKVLSAPVDNTLFFAGEALYEGTETGTVEGALVSGTEVARGIIAQS